MGKFRECQLRDVRETALNKEIKEINKKETCVKYNGLRSSYSGRL